MRFWIEDGKRYREPKYYATAAESYRDCERIWSDNYGGMPEDIKPGTDRTNVDVWTGGDAMDSWLKNFWIAYNSL